MELKKIVYDDFDAIYSEMEKNFVKEERRDYISALKLLDKEEYFVYHIMVDGENVGFITVWLLSDFTFIEHFVVYEKYRNLGYGGMALSLIKEKYCKAVLEAEPPEVGIRERRVAFYERNGFVRNPQKYIQPAYREGGDEVELVLMSCPTILSDFDRAVEEIYKKVYSKNIKEV